MDFDQMLAIWRTQNTTPPHDVNRDALRQALQAEEAKVRATLRARRRGLWLLGIFGTGMAIWAAFWIAITITNGWPAIYAITAGASVGLFAIAIVSSCASDRGGDAAGSDCCARTPTLEHATSIRHHTVLVIAHLLPGPP